MKYIAVLDSENEFTEEVISALKNTAFLADNPYYAFEILSIEKQERKVGKWVYDKAIQNWRCSVCNETPKTMGFCGTSDFMTEHFKFCNHCGSEMRGCENG